MAFERLKRFARRFSSPTGEEKIASLQERKTTLSAQRDKIYEDTASLERWESNLVVQGKTSRSKIVRRRLASQVAQIRRDLHRQHTTATMINGQVDILSTDIHNLTLLQQGSIAKLTDSQEIIKNAVRAEEILESLSDDVAQAATFEPGTEEISPEELNILAEFEETGKLEEETGKLEEEAEEEVEEEPMLGTSRLGQTLGYPEIKSNETA